MRIVPQFSLLVVIMSFSLAAGGCNGARDTALNLGETSSHRGFIMKTLVNEGRTRQYCVFLPMNYTPTRKWPAIMFLHGVGEAGHDLHGPMRVGLAPFVADRKDDFPFIVIIPQSSGGWAPDSDNATDAIAALLQAEKDYAIDPDRVSLTGLSTGGYGTFAIGAKYNHLFAALAPMCPSGADGGDGDVLGRMNIWAFENAADPFVTPMSMAITLGSIKSNGGTLKHTVYPAFGHDCWETAYKDGQLFDWLQQQHRSGAVANAVMSPSPGPTPKPVSRSVDKPVDRPVTVAAPVRTTPVAAPISVPAPAVAPSHPSMPAPERSTVPTVERPGSVPSTPY